jgi:N-acetylneuraminic acid mutarotase
MMFKSLRYEFSAEIEQWNLIKTLSPLTMKGRVTNSDYGNHIYLVLHNHKYVSPTEKSYIKSP